MSRSSLMAAVPAALMLAALPASAQDFPDGPGKETVTAVCGGCHDINRLNGVTASVRQRNTIVQSPVIRSSARAGSLPILLLKSAQVS